MGVVGRRAHRVTAGVKFWKRGVRGELVVRFCRGRVSFACALQSRMLGQMWRIFGARRRKATGRFLHGHWREEMDHERYLGRLFHRCSENRRERVERNFLARD